MVLTFNMRIPFFSFVFLVACTRTFTLLNAITAIITIKISLTHYYLKEIYKYITAFLAEKNKKNLYPPVYMKVCNVKIRMFNFIIHKLHRFIL